MTADQKPRRTGRLAAAMFSQLEAPATEEIGQSAGIATADTRPNTGTQPAPVPQSSVSAPASSPTPTKPVEEAEDENANEKVTVILPKSILVLLDAELKRQAKRGLKLSRSALVRSYILDKLAPEE